MTTLYVSDLDGTLLNSSNQISAYSLAVLNRQIAKGMRFTYATARSRVSAAVVTEGLSIEIPAVVYNGTFIMQTTTGKLLYSQSFCEEERRFVQKVLTDYDLAVLVYSFQNSRERVSWRRDRDRENDGIRRYLAQRRGDSRLRPVESTEDLYAGDSFYFTCIGEKAELTPIYQLFQADPRYTCTLQQELYRPEYWCEIMPRKATKANAILALKSMWGCDRIVCFGDAINDLPMFQVSDECYAVANAAQELKALATSVIAGNDEDGVARWLDMHVTEMMENLLQKERRMPGY